MTSSDSYPQDTATGSSSSSGGGSSTGSGSYQRDDSNEPTYMTSGEDSDEGKYSGTNEDEDLRTGLDQVVGGIGMAGPESDNFNRGGIKYSYLTITPAVLKHLLNFKMLIFGCRLHFFYLDK